jgi:hypothetical protein
MDSRNSFFSFFLSFWGGGLNKISKLRCGRNAKCSGVNRV